MDFIADLPWDKFLEVLGFSVGLLYLWWEYHADRRLWYASMIMPAISMWLYLSKGIYADFAINIYYLAIAVYGWRVWTRSGGKNAGTAEKKTKKGEIPVSRISRPMLLGCTAAFLAIWGALYCVLIYLTDSVVPLADSFTTALSIVGMWMLARKYLEQWIAWILVDAVCVGLYAYKGLFLYAVLYSVYTVIAFLGYRKWRRMIPGTSTA